MTIDNIIDFVSDTQGSSEGLARLVQTRSVKNIGSAIQNSDKVFKLIFIAGMLCFKHV